MKDEVEERSVALAELSGGIQLRAGHRVVLFVSGVKGRPRPRIEGEDQGPASGGRKDEPVPGAPGGVEGAEFEIEVQLTAAGGTPLAHERIRIHDPDTGEPVGEAAVTDESGLLRARVPAQKEYHFHVEAGPAEEHADPWGSQAQELPERISDPDEHCVLLVALADAQGQPLKGEKVQVKGAGGEGREAQTNDEGELDLIVEPGAYTIEARGKSFVAHSLFTHDLGDHHQPYRFVLR